MLTVSEEFYGGNSSGVDKTVVLCLLGLINVCEIASLRHETVIIKDSYQL